MDADTGNPSDGHARQFHPAGPEPEFGSSGQPVFMARDSAFVMMRGQFDRRSRPHCAGDG